MATVPILSKKITLSYAGKVIALISDFQVEINKEIVDITTLDSDGWKEKLVDLKEWNISFNSIVSRGADGVNTVFDELLNDIINNDAAVAIVVLDTGVGGTLNLSGNAFLVSLPLSVKVGDSVSTSGKLEGTGPLAIV